MSEDPKTFTVKDRRHFTPDGQAREETREDEAGAGASAEKAAPAPPDDAPEAGSATPPPERYETGGAGFGQPIDFEQFIRSLGAQAGLLLVGEALKEDPVRALAEARSLISILEMLKDKSEGRRTPEEDSVLDDLLYQLRMAFVARAREAGE